MLFRTNFVLCLALMQSCFGADRVLVVGDEPGPWPAILKPLGITVREAADIPPSAIARHIEAGAIVVLSGAPQHAEALGIKALSDRVPVRSIVDKRNPRLPIIWQKPVELPRYSLPETAEVFAYERWTKAPVLAGIRKGQGAALWLAAHPGDKGYERYPYILQSLKDLGLDPPFTSNRLWAFFDGAYRTRVDLDYFAEQWSRAGISALHVAAWHYMQASPEQDAWVKQLIAACHRKAIQVYAWIELPHVSESFWSEYPQCREKTGLLQDAHLDWRKLINLANEECRKKTAEQVRGLLRRFDWDGVNLAELYFESLEGATNPARFTPMNEDVRREYQAQSGIDPLVLLEPGADPQQLHLFLAFRAQLAKRMQEQWLGDLGQFRRAERPHLDLVLTHVDDRFDTRMGELIGADSKRVLPLQTQYDFTFLVEDPATVWHLGPERYAEIARRYATDAKQPGKLAIDINIVERYQDVYPTKQQTGTELFQLLQVASAAFQRVALYFENSILKPDWELLPAASATITRSERIANKLVVESPHGVGVRWAGAALVDGRIWPASDGTTVWLTPGAHVIEPAVAPLELSLKRFNGDLESARAIAGGIEFSYKSSARAMAVFDKQPQVLEVDGEVAEIITTAECVVLLPRGQHVVTVRLKEPARVAAR